ncbi:MAG: TonB-dependent receptor, partial [Chitinophagaceae bacterium]
MKYFIVPFFFIFTVAKSQNFTISGKVVDSSSLKPLSGATIVLSLKNNRNKTIVTNGEGLFTAPFTSNFPISVTFRFPGFQSKELLISKTNESNTIQLGTIVLNPIIASLTEVVVKGKKPPVSFKVDRQVFKTATFANANGGSGVDVVRNLPSISVNGQGEISFRGSTSFLVLINGKPTQGDPSFVLSQLPANAIESVEIITSPSAAFDADGKSGIINIVTKTGMQDGWMLQANALTGTPPLNDFNNQRNTNPQRHSVDVAANYKQRKWDISSGINYLRNDIAGFREGDVFTVINNVKTSFPSNGERSFTRYNYGARLAVQYAANANNTIGTAFYIGKRFQSRVADLLYQNVRENLSNGNTTQFNYFNENTQEKEGVFSLASVDYKHIFANKSSINFSGLYEGANLSGNTYNNNLAFPSLKDTLQYTFNPNKNPLHAYRIKADYSSIIGKGNFQMGYQYRYDTQDGNFTYLTKVLGTSNFLIDPQFTSNVKVSNNIHAAYIQYASVLKNFIYSTGIRVEYSDRNLQFSQNGGKENLRLTNLFPSLQIRYTGLQKTILKLGLSRRIKRNNNFELNPFPEREHSETLEQGDPKLLPELIYNIETGIEKSIKNGSFYVTAYFQNIKNPIQRVNKVFNDTILNRVFTNAASAIQLGIEANFTQQITPFWQTVIGGNLYKYRIKGSIFNGVIAVNNSSWIFSFNST